MTYQKLKENIVDERKVLTEKKFRRLLLRIALFSITSGACLTLAALRLVGFGLAILVVASFVVVFILMCDLCTESDDALRKISIASRFWVIFPILFVVVYYVLSYYNFT